MKQLKAMKSSFIISYFFTDYSSGHLKLHGNFFSFQVYSVCYEYVGFVPILIIIFDSEQLSRIFLFEIASFLLVDSYIID